MALVRRPAAIDRFRCVMALVSAGLCGAAAPAPAAPRPPAVSVAVVVGSNHAPAPPLQDLRFADDDAVQSARTLALLGAESTLLVTADSETRELYPTLVPTGPATRAALRAAFQAAAARIAGARAEGRRTRL